MMTDYSTSITVPSAINPHVRFVIDRMSFGRRIDLMKAVREATVRMEFHDAGGDADGMQVSLLTAEANRIFVRWGLRAVHGLAIDGEPATPETLAELGPEELFLEALTAVKNQCGLSESEKKT